jgi:hypothetical protein
MEVKNMDSMNEMGKSEFIKTIQKFEAIANIICHTTHRPGSIVNEYTMALSITDVTEVDTLEVLEFVKKLSAQTKYTYEECIEYARKYFMRGDYKIYSPDEYSLFISQDYLFVIPNKDNEPTKLIKMA